MKFAFVVLVAVGVVAKASGKPHGTNPPDEKHLEKRSLYTDISSAVGFEKISKRDVDAAVAAEHPVERGERSVYFLPAFARRGKRSVDDMDTAESGVYFLPSFARRGKRSVDDMDTAESGVYFLPSFARRGKRSVDDMDTAESGVYFLPSFARRG